MKKYGELPLTANVNTLQLSNNIMVSRDILAGVEGRGGGNIRSTAQTAGCRRVSIQVNNNSATNSDILSTWLSYIIMK